MAKDADPRLLQPLVQEAVRQRVPLIQVDTMRQLGEALRHLRGRRHRGGGMTPYFWF